MKDTGSASNPSTDSESEDDCDSNQVQSDGLDGARYTVSDNEDWDEMDIFSPHLPPGRRIVDSKESAGGLTLHKTAEGQWLSETELHRLANMARNARILSDLGIEEAKRRLTTRSGRGEDEDDKEPEVEDDQEFSVAPTKTAVIPRERHARKSKENVT